MSVRLITTNILFPGKEPLPNKTPKGTPIRSAIMELHRLILKVTPIISLSRRLPENINSMAFWNAVPIKTYASGRTPSLNWKVRKVALSVRMYAPCSFAMVRHTPMPAFAEVYQSV